MSKSPAERFGDTLVIFSGNSIFVWLIRLEVCYKYNLPFTISGEIFDAFILIEFD